MTHEIVLQKKQERLVKYTGSKLRRKQRALEKAQRRKEPLEVQLAGKTDKEPETVPVAEPKEAVVPVAEPKEATVAEAVVPVAETRPAKDETPEWRVEFSDGKTLTVRATSEKKARTAARDAESLPRLPAGTKVERISA